jgi:hypothetical protein
MAVGWGGTLITSPDGRSWTIRDPRVSRDLHKVAAGKGTFIVTGYMDPIIIQSDELMALPIISATPRHLMFGNVRVGGFAQENVVITNVGKANLSISSVADPGSPFAKVADGCSGRTFIPGSSCIVSYRFSPATVGDNTRSSLVVSNDTESNPFHIYLSGRGVSPEITVTPSTVDFGPIIPGEVSLPQEVTVRNDGSVNLLVGTLSVNGTDASQFFISGNSCNGVTLLPSGSCSVLLRFAPVTIGPKSGNLIIPSNDVDENNVVIPLSGIGGTPDISIEPVAVEFGFVPNGQNRNQAVLVSNIGTAPLELGILTNPSPPYSIGNTTCVPGTILQPGENCSITANFSPASNGSFSSQIAIESDDPEEPTVVTELSGASGPDLTGAWNSLAQVCKDTAKGLRCKITGTFLVRNLGTEKASGFLRFYLSSDGSYDAGSDMFLKQIRTGRVAENGGSKLKKISLKLPTGISPSGQYVVAMIDPDNEIIEGDETNNVIVFGPCLDHFPPLVGPPLVEGPNPSVG